MSEERARELMDAAFGIGLAEAHNALRRNAEAKRIYDCAIIQAIPAAIQQERAAVVAWLRELAKFYSAHEANTDPDAGEAAPSQVTWEIMQAIERCDHIKGDENE